ncbi:hypothetical protein ONS95_000384 [Cadophora gregata]|uniref:uncharacterized protein n=1 Tax=Cadophora gregata TaxID=51156 RepID=UPI0026DCF05F|nr:uncharacterized protein ONS95_000384 [Cadophora gregata]KAK0128411.1 hypothetical protein ONS95_000384 [Cadophora gregata]
MPSNIERKARRKKQTRLTFEPVSSSPVQTMSPAHVRYEPVGKRSTPTSSLQQATYEEADSESQTAGSAAKHKESLKVMAGSGKKKNIAKTLFKTLPTPAKSSQVGRDNSVDTLQNDSDSEEDIQPRSVRRSSGFLSSEKRKPITGLDEAESSDGSLVEKPHSTPSKNIGRSRGQRKEPEVITLDSDSEPEVYQLKPTRSRGRSNNKETSQTATRTMPLTNSGPRRARRSKPVELSEDEIQLPMLNKAKEKDFPKSKATARPKNGKSAFVDIDSEVDDDPIISSPKRSQRPLHKPSETSDSDEDVRSSPAKRRQQKMAVQEDDEEEDDEPVVSPLKRNREIVSDDSEAILASPMKRRRPITRLDSNSDDLPTITTLSRRKGKERAKSPSQPPETPMRTRQAKTRRHRTAKEKTMELLKRRRAGENIEELTASESDDDDDEDDFQKLDEFDDEEQSPEQLKKFSKSKVKVRRQRGDSSDEEAGESDFVIEDNDGPLGVPDYAQLMPLEFTQAAHKPLKEHFRDVVEWMVQNKLNPGFTWNDPVYVQAFQKLDNEYLGFADSKFVSTQWTAEFNRAVYARPTILITKLAPGEGIDALGESKCEPCNHRNHHPSFAIQFTGKAYHKATLEEIDSESDDSDEEDDDSNDSDKASVNSKGQPLPSTDKIWMSGSVCKQNAEQAHTLIHWRWHLNDWVVGNLEEQGYLRPSKLAAREKLTTNKRMKLANAVVDSWEADKTIKNLYHDFKVQLETARELKAQARGGWK